MLHGIWITENCVAIKSIFLIIRLTLIATFIEPLMSAKDLSQKEKDEIFLENKGTIQQYLWSYLEIIDEKDNGLRQKIPNQMFAET